MAFMAVLLVTGSNPSMPHWRILVMAARIGVKYRVICWSACSISREVCRVAMASALLNALKTRGAAIRTAISIIRPTTVTSIRRLTLSKRAVTFFIILIIGIDVRNSEVDWDA